MRRSIWKTFVAGVLTIALAMTNLTVGENHTVAKAGGTELTKVLEAEDIDLRAAYEDSSNLGDKHQIVLSDGSTIQIRDNGSMRTDISSQKLADENMGMGINLGNTLEAVWLVENKSQNTDRTEYDKAWGQPVTTREYINLIHSYGINTLRIPVAWSNGDVDDGEYNIKGALLDRVEEVVNYALDNGMYVIINDHWDNQWWGQFGACKKNAENKKVVDEETRAEAWIRYEKYWKQIATRFEKYSDHLIFEGANEELGDRLNDGICVNGPAKGYCKPDNATKEIEVVSGNLNSDELYEMVNKINQKFVDVIRSTGGNNKYRHLMIPGYNTDFTATADKRFVMPTDTEENGKSKLFLSVHYYTPGDYCLDNPSGDYTLEDQKATVDYFKLLESFSEEGYGIVVGECSVCNPSAVSSSVTQWLYDTFSQCAKYHAVPVLWDNGAYFDRVNLKMNYKDIAVFYNTINQADGATDMANITGGKVKEEFEDQGIPKYLDEKLWSTKGIHAYIMYQTSTWDYRNEYKPLYQLSNNQHSWEYATGSGAELTKERTKVTDVMITGDGEYKVALEGIDLSGANVFKLLGVATDIDKKVYPDVQMTDATIKFDGKVQGESRCILVNKKDNPYLTFMAINSYDPVKSNYPLGEVNENEELSLPEHSIEITFTISGMDKIMKDIAAGVYVDPETGKSYAELFPEKYKDTDDSGKKDTGVPNSPSDNLARGERFIKKGANYMVTDSTKKYVEYTNGAKGIKDKVVIPASVSVGGKKYTVTSIGRKAFKNNKKIKSVEIGKEIKKIGSQAFYGCKNLKSIKIHTKELSAKRVGENAFKKIAPKATIQVPKSKKDSYTKWLLKRGITKKMKIR